MNNNNNSNSNNNKVHWSVLEPISSNQVTGGKISINDADDDDPNDHNMGNNSADLYDEEAERRAFQEAVMEWRRSGKTTEKGGKIMTVSGSGGNNKQEQNNDEDDGMWKNPFSLRPQSSRSSGVGIGDSNRNSNNNDDESYTILSARSETYSSQGNRRGNLADGVLDEEKEQAVRILLLLLLL